MLSRSDEVPLPERLRPESLEQYIGQEHLTGDGAILRKMIDNNRISSFILWGPPGVGKTTLAKIVAKSLNRQFYILSAINSGVKDLREIIDNVRSNRLFIKATPKLFIDEIHRFSKSQQDALLGAVEDGTIVLIGATTENPSFEVISPLLSRCQVFTLKSLDYNALDKILDRALNNDEVLSNLNIDILEKEALFRFSGGDARKLLNILDLIIKSKIDDNTPPSVDSANLETKTIVIDNGLVKSVLNDNIALYDKNGENHYDIISAFIKSIRGSDPNGALYWMARMIHGGEDPKFIARRMIILAAEDIGLSNPNALLLANSCFDAVHKIGMPESRIILSQTVIYLATSPKSNSAYLAIDAALEEVRNSGDLPVPLHLRNAPTKLMKELNYGKDYKYSHNYQDNFTEQEYLPPQLTDCKFYVPGNNSKEEEIKIKVLSKWKKYNY